MRLHVLDNGEKYNEFKLDAYDSVSFSPATGLLVLFEKDTGEVILEWPRVKSIEMGVDTSGWNLKINRIPEHR